jgi:glycerol-3-phosphate dehydrogenase
VHTDLVVVGGGIQGVTMALAAARKGLRPVLIERSEIAGGATGNSYGIIHGGLRYLQTLDLPRWKRSKAAQRWFFENYPSYVAPLRCVLPLYKGCFRSPPAFRAAGMMETVLFGTIGGEPPLPRVDMISAADVLKDYPVPAEGLSGAAIWYDAQITDLGGLMTAMLNDAGLGEGSLLANTEATGLATSGGRVTGVRFRDRNGGEEHLIESPIVINCAGSWVNQWNDRQAGPSAAALAFNLLLDLPFPGDAALAVSERPGRGRSYFLRPSEGRTFAGTFYRAAPGELEPTPSDADVQQFLAILDRAMPGFGLAGAKVLKVMPGLLPDTDGRGADLSSRDVVTYDQPKGFHTVLGGKLTTAPLLSFDVAERLWPGDATMRRAA